MSGEIGNFPPHVSKYKMVRRYRDIFTPSIPVKNTDQACGIFEIAGLDQIFEVFITFSDEQFANLCGLQSF